MNTATPKNKKPHRKDKFYLAALSPDSVLTLITDINDAYVSRQKALEMAKKMPEEIEKHDVRVVSMSGQITVKRKEVLKFNF